MSTGYGWKGIRHVYKLRYVRRCLVHTMYLSASGVAVSILGALYKYSTFTFIFSDPRANGTPEPWLRHCTHWLVRY